MLSKPIAIVMGLFMCRSNESMRYFIFPIIFIAVACGSGAQKEGQSLKDLERAITAIEDRQQAEYDIIKDHERIIEILEENITQAKSEGMKEKIRNDINEKKVIIRDAQVNLENQERILSKLYAQKDSLEGR
jgi:septal ring factor EnvC (AmiA/AmiB activator)